MDRLQELGRACYKRKDYAKALEHFDRAIGRGPTVQLLDNRAACHEKVGNLPAALKDAKKAIQLQREDATGYLRAGKVLIKMEKQSVALELYSHGLKSIKHVGQGYEALRKVHGELLNELSPPKSIDPMTVLPRELAEYVLDFLTFKQRMNACLVSMQWTKFIRSAPSLWRHLDLTGARRKVKNAFISRAINVGRQCLRSATLTSLYDPDKALIALARHTKLEELRLLDTGLQSQNLVDALRHAKHLTSLHTSAGTELRVQAMMQIISQAAGTLVSLQCDHLTSHFTHDDLPKCPKLLNLALKTKNVDTAHVLSKRFVEAAPRLTSLTLHTNGNTAGLREPLDFRELQLETLDIRLPVPHLNMVRLPPTLRSLKLVFWSSLAGHLFGNPAMTPEDLPYLPVLRELFLEIQGYPANSAGTLLSDTRSVNELPQHVPSDSIASNTNPQSSLVKLQRLSLPRCAMVCKTQLQGFLQHERLQDLEHLSVSHSHDCNDGSMQAIAEALPRLQSLDVSGTDITGVGLKEVVNCCSLKHVIVNDCRNLGRDAVDWAQTQGISVENKMSTEMSGSKKVRY